MNCITFTQSQARERERESDERRMSGWVVLVRRWLRGRREEIYFFF
jgi:hypothetical protein